MEATSIIDTASLIGAASLIYATFLRIEDISLTYLVTSYSHNFNLRHLTREFIPKWFLNLPLLVPRGQP